jgi:hypothetical protein
MNNNRNSFLFIIGGISGVVGTICYVIAITIPLNQIATFGLAIAWPILSIVFAFSLYRYYALERKSVMNELAFLFASLAFTILACMMSIQLAVGIGMEEYMAKSSYTDQQSLKVVERSVRLVDMGLDVAWDMFIGTSLIFLSIALKQHSGFGTWWGLPSGVLGVTLIILNLVTFPWPPANRGLFDIGPVVGLYIICLSTRLLLLGIRISGASAKNAHLDS